MIASAFKAFVLGLCLECALRLCANVRHQSFVRLANSCIAATVVRFSSRGGGDAFGGANTSRKNIARFLPDTARFPMLQPFRQLVITRNVVQRSIKLHKKKQYLSNIPGDQVVVGIGCELTCS